MENIKIVANTSQEAWEHINEIFIKGSHPEAVFKSHCQYIYNVFLQIQTPWIDPDIDIFKYFHYSKSKWGGLIGNYLNIPHLRALKEKLSKKSVGKYSYKFTNSHKNGKACLTEMVIVKEVTHIPELTFFLRASEVTKRLLIDLVFFQRIGEYLFGGSKFRLNIQFEYLFQDDPVLIMYSVHRPDFFKSCLRGQGIKQSKRKLYLSEIYSKMLNASSLDDFKYKIYKRILKVVRPDLDTVSPKPLMVKELSLKDYL